MENRLQNKLADCVKIGFFLALAAVNNAFTLELYSAEIVVKSVFMQIEGPVSIIFCSTTNPFSYDNFTRGV